MKRARTGLALALISILVAATTATAQVGPDAGVKERIDFIQGALDAAQPGAQAWWFGWIAAYGAGTIATGTLAGLNWNNFRREPGNLHYRKVRDRAFAEDMLVSSVTFALGVGGQVIFPFKPAYLPDRLRAMPETGAAERRAKLSRAEEILRECAQQEREGWGWLPHTLNLTVNIGAGLVTVFAFRRPWTDGLITFATGEAVSLLNIFTQPRRAIRDLARYDEKYRGGAAAREDEQHYFFALCPGGIMAGTKF
jgi:hypothetical protein